MPTSVKHALVATLPDNPEYEIGTTEWNDEHVITGTANTLAGFDGSGNFTEVTAGSGLSLSSGTLTATGGGVTAGFVIAMAVAL